MNENTYTRFGVQSLLATLIKSVPLFVIFIAGRIALWYVINHKGFENINSMLGFSIDAYVTKGFTIIMAFVIVVCMITVIINYMSTEFRLDEHAFSLRKGILVRHEQSFPLRYIHNVSSRQGLVDQMFGVCTCIIEMTADDGDDQRSDDIVLRNLDVKLFHHIQDTLLSRVNTQKIVVNQA